MRAMRATRALWAAVTAVVALVAVPVPSADATVRTTRSDPVTITVQDVSPPVPVVSTRHLPLTVTLSLENTSGSPMTAVSITAERGSPIGNQAVLDDELSRTSEPAPGGLGITPVRAVTTDLPAGGAVQVQFRTTTSLLDDRGICLCHNAVYPLLFSATTTGSDGSAVVVGSATTYLPSFDAKPAPVKVAWLWPLIDRPHRLGFNTVFTDDALADSVEQGRLSRALAVIESVTDTRPQLPITLLVDPELLDELEVMATRKYTYRTTGGRTTAGQGQDAARTWLSRFDTVIHLPGIQVALTPYADPDVQSLTSAGLGWANALPSVMSDRIDAVLDGVEPVTDLAWPASTRIDRPTLDAMRAAGTRTVILGSKAVTPSTDDGGAPSSVARLSTSGGVVSAALTNTAVRRYVRSSTESPDLNAPDSAAGAALPRLMAELAVQLAQEPQQSHLDVLTPPRYVDPSVDAAARTILATNSSPFTTPVALRAAVRSATSAGSPYRLAKLPSPITRLPLRISAAAQGVQNGIPVVDALLRDSTAAAPLLAGLPLAVQRIESSAWRSDATGGGVRTGLLRAKALGAQMHALRTGVQIVAPKSNNYTLASRNSPLPITVTNNLDYPVDIDVLVEAVDGLPGFTARRLTNQHIAARSKMTLKVRTELQLSGRIQVQAQLRTTSDQPVGRVVPLSVRSTVLGLIGVIITTVAGLVLVLALLIRFLRRVQRRRASASAPRRTRRGGLAASTDSAT